MLIKWSAYHGQAALTSLNSLYRTPIATIMTILVVAVSLTLPAIFWVMTTNMAQLTLNWQRSSPISLYLKTSLSPQDEAALLKRVQQTVGVKQAILKSPAQGLAELQRQEGMENIMRYLPKNPLPALIDVVPTVDMNNPKKIQQLYLQLKAYPQVEQTKMDVLWMKRLSAIFGFTGRMAKGLMAILALAVVLIIANTLRLALHHRYEEVQVLKLIGAKDSFIIRPFLYTGMWYGLAGSIVAVFLVNVFMLSLKLAANQLFAVYQMNYSFGGLSFIQAITLIASAVFLGWLGAFVSIKKQIATIEPG